MSPNIRILEPGTVNKIAAGEVIERPASVIRELVENSIDAGATKILIEVAEGGKRLIKVADDGCGMDRDDAVLAFEKHATSKISDAEDLDNITTLGFRGEALCSIASVARSVTLKTKTKSDNPTASGTHIQIEAGVVKGVKDTGCPLGTTIEVRDLFYNVPARRKYMKSARAELARITDLVTSYAIINHHMSFELFSGKKTIFKSVRSNSWNDAILRILGNDVARGLIPIETRSDHVTISGVVGKHIFTRSSPDWVMIYVNGRKVRSRAMARAVAEAYRTLIPRGRHPIAVISLQVDPAQVDVNVHPAKREVRFLREEELARVVTDAVCEVLQSVEGTETSPEQVKALQKSLEPDNGVYEGTEETGSDKGAGSSEKTQDLISSEGEMTKRSREIQKSLPFAAIEPKDVSKLDLENSKMGLRVLGQILKLYIVAEGSEGLVLVDQHAAAERVKYERLQKKHRTGMISQELIEPLNLELSPREQVMLEDRAPLLEEMGFEIVPFGGNAYNVRSVPAIGTKLERPEAVHDILRDLFSLGKVSIDATTRDDVLKLLACRGSIKAGHEMTWKEMQQLLRDLSGCENPKTCPHGRPTMVTISPAQLEKIFKRR